MKSLWEHVHAVHKYELCSYLTAVGEFLLYTALLHSKPNHRRKPTNLVQLVFLTITLSLPPEYRNPVHQEISLRQNKILNVTEERMVSLSLYTQAASKTSSQKTTKYGNTQHITPITYYITNLVHMITAQCLLSI